RAELRELHGRGAHEPRGARLLLARRDERLPHLREPHRPEGAPAPQHEWRQPRGVLHARARAADRGGAPAARTVDDSGAGRARGHGDLGPHGHAGVEHDPRNGDDAVTGAASSYYLPAGLPHPVAEPDGLDTPYWEGTRAGELRVQRCRACRAWQWGPEWICHGCLAFDLDWVAVEPH